MTLRLQDRIALVTGGATGIGRAIALRFAREGARVTIADINAEQGAVTAGEARGLFLSCDTSQPDDVKTTIARVEAEFGGLDILVASAAHLGGPHDVGTIVEEEWRAVMAVTLDGVFHSAKYAVPAMVRRGGGAIVLIASVEGITGVARHAAYVTAKSALFGLTRSMAIDYGRQGIRVNAISPGIIDSGRPDIDAAKRNPGWMRFWQEMTVLGRLGTPDEIAAAAAFLASDEASYITGHNLTVDGGWTIGHPPFPERNEDE